MRLVLFSLFLLLFVTTPVSAHPGGTDGKDGHRCHTNCEQWGLKSEEYHYHNSDGSIRKVESVPAKLAPVKQFAPISTVAPTPIPTRIVTSTPTPTSEPTKTPVNTTTIKEPKPTTRGVKNESEDSGGVVGLALLVGLGYFGYRRLKKRKQLSKSPNTDDTTKIEDKNMSEPGGI